MRHERPVTYELINNQGERMQRAAHFATVVAALVAIAMLGLGFSQFIETQKLTRENLRLQTDVLNHERESKAIEFFLKFNELQKEVAGKPLPRKGDVAFWHHNMLLTLTESIFRLTEGDPGWRETVVWMLQTQKPFLDGIEQGCRTFATEFVVLMKSAAPAMKCV
jgi:hypothetical protein